MSIHISFTFERFVIKFCVMSHTHALTMRFTQSLVGNICTSANVPEHPLKHIYSLPLVHKKAYYCNMFLLCGNKVAIGVHNVASPEEGGPMLAGVSSLRLL